MMFRRFKLADLKDPSGYVILANGLGVSVSRQTEQPVHGFLLARRPRDLDPDLVWYRNFKHPVVPHATLDWLAAQPDPVMRQCDDLWGFGPRWVTDSGEIAAASRPLPRDVRWLAVSDGDAAPRPYELAQDPDFGDHFPFTVRGPDGSVRYVTAGGLVSLSRSRPPDVRLRAVAVPPPNSEAPGWIAAHPHPTAPWAPIPKGLPGAQIISVRGQAYCWAFRPQPDYGQIAARTTQFEEAVRRTESFYGFRDGTVAVKDRTEHHSLYRFRPDRSDPVRILRRGWFAATPTHPDPDDIVAFGIGELLADPFVADHAAPRRFTRDGLTAGYFPASDLHVVRVPPRGNNVAFVFSGADKAIVRYAIQMLDAAPPAVSRLELWHASDLHVSWTYHDGLYIRGSAGDGVRVPPPLIAALRSYLTDAEPPQSIRSAERQRRVVLAKPTGSTSQT